MAAEKKRDRSVQTPRPSADRKRRNRDVSREKALRPSEATGRTSESKRSVQEAEAKVKQRNNGGGISCQTEPERAEPGTGTGTGTGKSVDRRTKRVVKKTVRTSNDVGGGSGQKYARLDIRMPTSDDDEERGNGTGGKEEGRGEESGRRRDVMTNETEWIKVGRRIKSGKVKRVRSVIVEADDVTLKEMRDSKLPVYRMARGMVDGKHVWALTPLDADRTEDDGDDEGRLVVERKRGDDTKKDVDDGAESEEGEEEKEDENDVEKEKDKHGATRCRNRSVPQKRERSVESVVDSGTRESARKGKEPAFSDETRVRGGTAKKIVSELSAHTVDATTKDNVEAARFTRSRSHPNGTVPAPLAATMMSRAHKTALLVSSVAPPTSPIPKGANVARKKSIVTATPSVTTSPLTRSKKKLAAENETGGDGNERERTGVPNGRKHVRFQMDDSTTHEVRGKADVGSWLIKPPGTPIPSSTKRAPPSSTKRAPSSSTKRAPSSTGSTISSSSVVSQGTTGTIQTSASPQHRPSKNAATQRLSIPSSPSPLMSHSSSPSPPMPHSPSPSPPYPAHSGVVTRSSSLPATPSQRPISIPENATSPTPSTPKPAKRATTPGRTPTSVPNPADRTKPNAMSTPNPVSHTDILKPNSTSSVSGASDIPRTTSDSLRTTSDSLRTTGERGKNPGRMKLTPANNQTTMTPPTPRQTAQPSVPSNTTSNEVSDSGVIASTTRELRSTVPKAVCKPTHTPPSPGPKVTPPIASTSTLTAHPKPHIRQITQPLSISSSSHPSPPLPSPSPPPPPSVASLLQPSSPPPPYYGASPVRPQTRRALKQKTAPVVTVDKRGAEVDDDAGDSSAQQQQQQPQHQNGLGVDKTLVSHRIDNVTVASGDVASVIASATAETSAREAQATAELWARYKAAVMRAVPCVYDDYFKLEEDRVCAPFPASHVQMGTIVAGKGDTWWRAIPRISGGCTWKEIVATENVHCLQIATQTVTDKKGRTLAVKVAITNDILL